jgi:hypothetical protein
MIGKIMLTQTSHLLPPVFAGGKRLFVPEFPATSSGRWDGSKNPIAQHRKGDKSEKTLSGAALQHVMAGLPPVKTAQMTGSRRPTHPVAG